MPEYDNSGVLFVNDRKEKENQPDYISQAIQAGFDAEIDIWYQDGLYLGHDNPEYEIDLDFLFMLHDKLWIHCKNIQALSFLSEIKEFNTFWHEKDSYALTSKGFILGVINSPATGSLNRPRSIRYGARKNQLGHPRLLVSEMLITISLSSVAPSPYSLDARSTKFCLAGLKLISLSH